MLYVVFRFILLLFKKKPKNKLRNTTRCHLLYIYVKQSIICIFSIANVISILTILYLKKKLKQKYFNNQICTICMCSCGHCMQMPLAKECVCCKETRVLLVLMKNDEIQCITDHPGFEPVCLNTYVLDTAHNQYKRQYNRQIQNISEKVVMKK